jgi:alkanesulfonate monooxygenase SsuD/methylene tetrahydromethanopterin reductase-like flavin-dependent oxidoreductase (luciferase family)
VKVGIGLPTTIPGVQREQMLDWARRADAAGFSTLGTLDRLIYPNWEPLTSLSAAAAVTERIGLMTAVLLLPYRQNAAVVAKEAATVHALSGGRLTLGAGIGSRDEDYTAFGLPTRGRGRRMNEMLAEIRRLWEGEEVGYAGGVGPDVRDDPPQIVVGGSSDQAFRRAAEYGDGWMLGGGSPDRFAELSENLMAAWRERGREGEPRRLALTYFALGDDPEGDTDRSIRDYYSFTPEYADVIVAATAKGDDAVRERLDHFRRVGVDEVVMFPASPDPAQVDLLARVAL